MPKKSLHQIKTVPDVKPGLHPKNRHASRYDFKKLIEDSPQLKSHVFVNQYGDESIDFSNPLSVKILNQALLKSFYNISFWDIPDGFLCPPVPGRADYIHNLADLIPEPNSTTNENINCLDIGTGANLIYPIIGNAEYNWSFTGSDIDQKAISSAQTIIENNPQLKNRIRLLLQKNKNSIFKGIILTEDRFTFTLSNPPFHSSEAEAMEGNLRKTRNLKLHKSNGPKLNFGGKSNELWTEGGELQFIKNMIDESRSFSKNCLWFTTLVSKQNHLPILIAQLERTNIANYKVLEMGQGQKKSRILAWTFQDKNEHLDWWRSMRP